MAVVWKLMSTLFRLRSAYTIFNEANLLSPHVQVLYHTQRTLRLHGDARTALYVILVLTQLSSDGATGPTLFGGGGVSPLLCLVVARSNSANVGEC